MVNRTGEMCTVQEMSVSRRVENAMVISGVVVTIVTEGWQDG